MKGTKKYLVSLSIAIGLCVLTWTTALWVTRARIDLRPESDSGFIALRFSRMAGVSIQWSEQGYSAWLWTPDRNERLWSND
jgi:hypothetical protein